MEPEWLKQATPSRMESWSKISWKRIPLAGLLMALNFASVPASSLNIGRSIFAMRSRTSLKSSPVELERRATFAAGLYLFRIVTTSSTTAAIPSMSSELASDPTGQRREQMKTARRKRIGDRFFAIEADIIGGQIRKNPSGSRRTPGAAYRACHVLESCPKRYYSGDSFKGDEGFRDG